MPTIEQARSWYSSNDPVHGFDHVQRVYDMAGCLALAEGADLEIVRAAALLHDAEGSATEGGDQGCSPARLGIPSPVVPYKNSERASRKLANLLLARPVPSEYNTFMNIPYGPLLVVEDVPNILELLEVTLRFKGYPVITARNGQEALEIISREHPALVITDILMPKMDGYTLVQRLRTDPKTSDIPIIFLSATYVTPEDKTFALSLGAVRFLEKPVDTEDFLLTIAEVLTMGPGRIPAPLGEREFYHGYRERLEGKLRYKNGQITRTQRLLETLPEEQKPAFVALLEEACEERNEIQRDLDELYRLMEQNIHK